MPGAKQQFTVNKKSYEYEAMSLRAYEDVLQEIASGKKLPTRMLKTVIEKFSNVDFDKDPYFVTALAILNISSISGLGEVDIVLNCDIDTCVKNITFNCGDCKLNREDYVDEKVIKVSNMLALKLKPAAFEDYLNISNAEYGSCEILASFCKGFLKNTPNGVEEVDFETFEQAVSFFENDFPAGLDMSEVMSTIYSYPDVVVEVKDCKTCNSKKTLIGFAEIFF